MCVCEGCVGMTCVYWGMVDVEMRRVVRCCECGGVMVVVHGNMVMQWYVVRKGEAECGGERGGGEEAGMFMHPIWVEYRLAASRWRWRATEGDGERRRSTPHFGGALVRDERGCDVAVLPAMKGEEETEVEVGEE